MAINALGADALGVRRLVFADVFIVGALMVAVSALPCDERRERLHIMMTALTVTKIVIPDMRFMGKDNIPPLALE
jgi:hypothetical protein